MLFIRYDFRMNKIFIIIIILLFQSFPSWGNEVEGKGLLCKNYERLYGIFFNKKKYEMWERDKLDTDKDGDKSEFKISSEEDYKVKDDMIILSMGEWFDKTYGKDKSFWGINRFTLNLTLYYEFGSKTGKEYSCKTVENKEKFTKKLDEISSKHRELYERHLKKRKF